VAFGGLGIDIISVFAGNDTVDAGDGNDVIWGGPGNDTIYGGPGEDYIYGGSGIDALVGGAGADWYYVSRDDGTETVTEVSGEGAVNHLVIFGSFSTSADGTQPSSEFVAGTGIHETDSGEALTVGHVLGNHTDTAAQTGNINVTYNSATSVTISVAGTSSQFIINPLLFADITLFNPDATNGHQMQELYTWDPNARGAGQGGFEFSAYIG
jgi:Ca2+-binding RTX toxin-like protein